jgi:hypothetical protein
VWSVKDSFAVLDLEPEGFSRLFGAQWLYLEAGAFTPTLGGQDIRYQLVRDTAGLAAWRAGWDPADRQLGQELFGDGLLGNPDLWFVAGYDVAGKLTSGCLVNRTGGVLGISNTFGGEQGASWSDMLRFIVGTIGRRDIVGYEGPGLARGLRLLGFQPVGELTVWLKRRAS